MRGVPVFNAARCRRLFIVATCLSMLLTRGRAVAADAAAPAGDDVVSKLADVEAEIGALRKGDARSPAAAYADQLEREVKVLRADWEAGDVPAAAPVADAAPELYVVGFYEGSMPNGPRKFGTAVVEVQVTERPVVLSLCAYEPIRWELRVAPGVRLQRVIVSGYGEQLLEPAPPAGVPVERYFHKAGDERYFYTYPGADPNGGSPDAAEALLALTGLPITTLQGAYRYAGKPVVVGPRDTQWRRQRVMNRLEPLWRETTAVRRAEARGAVSATRFTAIRWKPGRMRPEGELADFTPAGWIQGTGRLLPGAPIHVALDPRGPTWFGLYDRGAAVRLDLAAGTAAKIEVREDIPEFSWPCGLAFDTKRNRLLVSTLGGAGYLYACDTATDKWSVLAEMGNIDLQALAYSAEEDCLYGATVSREANGLALCQFDPDGGLVRQILVKTDAPVDPGPPVMSSLQVIPVGKQLVLLLPPSRREMMAMGRAARRPPGARGAAGGGGAVNAEEPGAAIKCLIVNPADGAVTFAAEMTRLPPAAADAQRADRRKLQEQWAELRQAAPADADKAAAALGLAGDGAVAVIRAALPPAPVAPDDAALRVTLAKLESDDWKQREQAAAELAAAGPAAEPALRAALGNARGEEARQRLDAVLKQLETLRDGRVSADQIDKALGDSPLRARLRAVRALAKAGTPAAAQLLREIAAGPPGSLDAAQARLALRKF